MINGIDQSSSRNGFSQDDHQTQRKTRGREEKIFVRSLQSDHLKESRVDGRRSITTVNDIYRRIITSIRTNRQHQQRTNARRNEKRGKK